MLGTGVRIGEAFAIRNGVNADGEPLLDLDHATVEINATIIRVKGQGLIVQEWPKTAAGWRRLALPSVRGGRSSNVAPHGPAPCGASEGGVRLRRSGICATRRTPPATCGKCSTASAAPCARVAAGCPRASYPGKRVRCDAGPFSWVTSHTFRKTVATRLDEAHLTARQIADQLGHAHPSLTQDVYMGRRVVTCRSSTTPGSRDIDGARNRGVSHRRRDRSRRRSVVHVATPTPKKSRSSVQMGCRSSRAHARTGQSLGSRAWIRAKASSRTAS